MKSTISNGLVHNIPNDLAQLLADKAMIKQWESLTPIGRNEFICWIEDAKQEKTRIKRLTRTIDDLNEGKKRPCCWPGCIHRTDKKPSKWQQDVLIDKKAK
ncbi:YdeI/OmpD-associated family protein [Colwellia sp. 1_MG-2023]|uniref:YdeI/OmpD-associated family protein n=1 Tax=Colwellia sp. 1_MG-2023 TaxID=3062649 RepID=UPI0026E48CA7|nr:YdeI/OmpD-associated family protein [Colwellia sp. 1_MG-2023]MDO6446951.1 YdeI/OmpD-associated family protein [Colwellia sp. 1_MG-2023]